VAFAVTPGRALAQGAASAQRVALIIAPP